MTKKLRRRITPEEVKQIQKSQERNRRRNLIRKYPPLKQKKWILTAPQINHRGRRHLFRIVCELFFCYENRIPIFCSKDDPQLCLKDLGTMYQSETYPVLLKSNPAKRISERTGIPYNSIRNYIHGLKQCGLIESHTLSGDCGLLKLYSIGTWKFIAYPDKNEDQDKDQKWNEQWVAYPNLTKDTVHKLANFTTSRK